MDTFVRVDLAAQQMFGSKCRAQPWNKGLVQVVPWTLPVVLAY